MKLKCNISILRIVSISFILAIIFSVFITAIPVNAAGTGAITEGDHADTQSSGSKYEGKWLSTYAKGAGYKGQGVLIYLLERDGGGAVAGTTPVAFPCTSGMNTYSLKATPKYPADGSYGTVTTWQGTLPYWTGEVATSMGGALINKNGTSNVESLKAWLKTPIMSTNDGMSTKGILMVNTIYGAEIAERFTNEQLILVIEPIIATQYSQYATSTFFKWSETYDLSVNKLYDRLILFRNVMSSSAIGYYTGMSADLLKDVNEFIAWHDEMLNAPFTGAYEWDEWASDVRYIMDMATLNFYMPMGDPMAGTANELINYYNSLSVVPFNNIVVTQEMLKLKIPNSFSKAESGYLWYRNYAQRAAYLKTGSIVCANANMNLWPANQSPARTHTQASILNDKYTTGMLAMLAFTTDGDGSQTTYDEPQKDTPAPPADESDGYCTIIKSYRDTNITTGVQTHVGTYHRNQVANLITIENEPTYKVVAWKTSTQGNTSISSINWENSVPGLIDKEGTTPTTVTLPDTHDYLYVLLEKVEKDKALDANYTLSQSSITRHINLNNPDQWSVGSGATSFTMQSLSSKTFSWWLSAHEDSCDGHDYNYRTCGGKHGCGSDCSDSNGDGTKDTCPGHDCDDDRCIHDTDYCDKNGAAWAWKDDQLEFGLKGTSSDDYVVATASKYRVVSVGTSTTAWTYDYTRTTTGSRYVNVSGLNFHGLVHRGYTQIVLADWKNTDTLGTTVSNDLKISNLSSKNYTVANSIGTSRPNRKSSNYTADFTIKFSDNSADRNTTYGSTANASGSKEQCGDNTTTSVLTSTNHSIKSKLAVLVYLGNPNLTECTTVPTSFEKYYDSTKSYVSGIAASVGTINDFRPYVEMKYDTLTLHNKKAYVLGEHKRSLGDIYAFGEVEWKKAETANLKISSLQWSTHAEARKFHDAGTVLPGGATLTLSIDSSARQKVIVRSYQPMLAGAGKNQVEKTSGTSSLTPEKAAQNHQDFVDSVVESLSNMHVAQYLLNTDAKTDTNYGGDRSTAKDVFEDGDYVDNGLDFDNTQKNGDVISSYTETASGELKYYFNSDASGGTNADSAEGDLDAVAGTTSVTYYTFWCDTSGNIRFASGADLNTVSNAPNNTAYYNDSTIICKRKAGSSDCEWTNNATYIIKDLDKKTCIVSKLVKNLEKAGGIDSTATWVTDGKWYNEAFDGVTYAVYVTEVTTGFSEPGERITVLDPKLCPQNNGKSDFFSLYNTTQIKMNDGTPEDNNDTTLVIGKFIGKDVPMMNADMLYWSEEFYIPNVTTQDLH